MKVLKKDVIKAYKVFNSDWTCRGFQYEVGKEYHHKGDITICQSGFHVCRKLADCFDGTGYTFDPKQTKVAKVNVWGEIDENDKKLCGSNIAIIEEMKWEEVLRLCNSGNRNSGYRNSGDWNSGNWNSGDWNSGDWNSGNRNSGNRNSGNRNSGNRNSGDWNSGDWNSGNWNSGDWNSGYRNSGYRNSGDWNSGDWNSGNRNSGYRNSGNWNSGNCNSGYFNTPMQNQFFCFNKLTKKTEIKFPDFLYFELLEWVNINAMTVEEKNEHPESDVIGGYLKQKDYKEAFRESFLEAKKKEDWQEQLSMLKAIPNFDAEIFYEISGIKPEELI